MNKIIHDNCFNVISNLPEKSIDVIYIDPPYFNIKGDFDKELNFEEWQDLHEKLSKESSRILKDNGSIILWGHAKNISYQQIIFDKRFNLLNSCVWEKTNGQAQRMSEKTMRTFAPVTERFLFYDKGEDNSGLTMIMSNPDLFKSIKEYMRSERKKIIEKNKFNTIEEFNIYIRKITDTTSVVDRHYFADSQYVFPTEEMYKKLQTTGFFRREYEELRREYEELRRHFDLKNKLQFDVIKWPQESNLTKKFKHPTQKPYSLTCEIIKTISRENDLILIPFSGSGTEAVACYETNRNFIAIEKDEKYYKISKQRLNEISQQGKLF